MEQSWFGTVRRLHPRGPRARGLTIDREGVMLGPDYVLVDRTSTGYRPQSGAALAALGRMLFPEEPQRLNRLPLLLTEIARALDRGELVKAQLLGLEVPLPTLDDNQLLCLTRAAALAKAGFNPTQPRVSAGSGQLSGRWTRDDAGKPGTSPIENETSGISSRAHTDNLEPISAKDGDPTPAQYSDGTVILNPRTDEPLLQPRGVSLRDNIALG